MPYALCSDKVPQIAVHVATMFTLELFSEMIPGAGDEVGTQVGLLA